MGQLPASAGGALQPGGPIVGHLPGRGQLQLQQLPGESLRVGVGAVRGANLILKDGKVWCPRVCQLWGQSVGWGCWSYYII